MAVGHVGKWRSVRAPTSQESRAQEHEPREQTLLFRSLSISNPPRLAVVIPTVANNLLPGMTDREVPPFPMSLRLFWTCVYSFPVQSLPSGSAGNRLVGSSGVLNCSFLAKLHEWHAYIIWPFLCSFPDINKLG